MLIIVCDYYKTIIKCINFYVCAIIQQYQFMQGLFPPPEDISPKPMANKNRIQSTSDQVGNKKGAQYFNWET
jgi:hypothetical protein